MPRSGLAPELMSDRSLPLLLFSLVALALVQGCAALPTNTNEPAFQRRYGDFTYCDTEVVRQTKRHSCGPACLSSVLTYWDVPLSEAQILQQYPSPEQRPYLLLALRGIAEAEGLKAYVVSMDTQSRSEVEEQISKGRPLICALHLPGSLHLLDGVPILGAIYQALAWGLNPRKNHFVVVVGLKPEEVLVMDPAQGFASISWQRFEKAWSQMKYACLLISN